MPGLKSSILNTECQHRLDALESEFKEGDITLKGYWKKKCGVLESVFSEDVKKKIDCLGAELKNAEITEKDYVKKIEAVVDDYLKHLSVTSVSNSNGCNEGHQTEANGVDENNAKETNGNGHAENVSNAANNLARFAAGSSENGEPFVSGKINSNGHVTNGTECKDETVTEDQNGDQMDTSKADELPTDLSEVMEVDINEVKDEDKSSGPPEKKPRGKASKGTPTSRRSPKNGHLSEDSEKEERTPRRSSRRSSRNVDEKQPSITSMFSAKPKTEQTSTNASLDSKAEKQSEDTDESENASKRMKMQENAKENIVPALEPSPPKPLPQRCNECLKYLDDPELKLFPGDATDAVEEFIALTDPKLSLYTGDEDFETMQEDRPQHKLTNFSVYDKNTHLCAFDTGLIERNKYLFFSGVLKPIFEENPSPEGGVPCRNMGPINEWFVSGFDGGENALIGFSTGYAEYILMQPSEAYSPFIEQMKLKVHMSKIVIEFLLNNQDASYEDLLNKIQTTVPPAGLLSFSEDSLLRHAQFVVDQVQSFDEAAAEDEFLLITTPCMRALITLAGVTLGKRRQLRKDIGRVKAKKEKPQHTMATVTPLVRKIFDSIFQGQIDDEATKSKRQRCGICEASVLKLVLSFVYKSDFSDSSFKSHRFLFAQIISTVVVFFKFSFGISTFIMLRFLLILVCDGEV